MVSTAWERIQNISWMTSLWIKLFVFSNVSVTEIYVTINKQIRIIPPSTELAALISYLSVSAGNHSPAGNVFRLTESVGHLDCSQRCQLKGIFQSVSLLGRSAYFLTCRGWSVVEITTVPTLSHNPTLQWNSSQHRRQFMVKVCS